MGKGITFPAGVLADEQISIENPRSLRIAKKNSGHRSKVTKSNDLARGQIDKTDSVLFGRLVNTVISQIKRNDEDFKDYSVHVSDLMPGHGGGTYYEAINKQFDLWLKVAITIHGNNSVTKYPIFSKIKLDKTINVITVNIHKDLKPFLLQLKENFTQYSLQEYMRLPTIKTQRLFEFLSSWKNKPQIQINIEQLHDILDSEQYIRKDFKMLRIRVLEPAQQHILKNSELSFDWIAVKVGRKVESVVFTFVREKKLTTKTTRPTPEKTPDN